MGDWKDALWVNVLLPSLMTRVQSPGSHAVKLDSCKLSPHLFTHTPGREHEHTCVHIHTTETNKCLNILLKTQQGAGGVDRLLEHLSSMNMAWVTEISNPGIVVHTSNPRTWKEETRGLRIQGHHSYVAS